MKSKGHVKQAIKSQTGRSICQNPRIAEIDRILSSTGIEVSKLVLQYPEKADELIKSLEQRNLDLVIEKQSFYTLMDMIKII